MLLIYFRLLSRLAIDENGEVEINFIYESFKFESIESGTYSTNTVPGQIAFIEHLKALFPTCRRARRKCGSTAYKTFYQGVSLRQMDNFDIVNFPQIEHRLPTNFRLLHSNAEEIHCECQSGFLSNGHHVYKKIIFRNNGTWELYIGNKKIELQKMHIADCYQLNTVSIDSIFQCVKEINLCAGISFNRPLFISRYRIHESWQKENDSPMQTVRSVLCLKVIPFNAKVPHCKTCKKMTLTTPQDKENVNPSENEDNTVASNKSKLDEIKKLFPNASEQMLELMVEQSKNVGKHPKGRRWSEKFIGVCLQLYNRSPHCYETLYVSRLLVLPSKSLLIMYKNAIKQNPGFEENTFEWMFNEANRLNIPEKERYGGIIFDEMSIQCDIEIDKQGNVVELSGFTDYGSEGDTCHALRTGTMEKSLGKYVLQLLFLGLNGFRFPFAHFITNGVQASEIYGLFWKAVYLLYSYGFKVLFTCMDGAQSNRSFMHICLGNTPTSYISRSPCTSYDIIFLMDISHVIKKVRNNILNSGVTQKSTRLLTLPSSYTVQWQMFSDVFFWDQQNAFQIHRKLTCEHFNLDCQLKMRNHLAEEILNVDMLYAMKMYQNTLGEKGQVLNGAIELLEQTSKLIQIFRDMRPIKCIDDSRIITLRDISAWFLGWTSSIQTNDSIPSKEKGKKLLSHQCSEDLQSCIQGFLCLCDKVLKNPSTIFVTPGLVNSDVIENIFNQQRSTYHGANSNPNALQYKRAINSVLVGQNIVSKKSNAGKSTVTCEPYSFQKRQPSRERQEHEGKHTSMAKGNVLPL